jgi:hypothetical protein
MDFTENGERHDTMLGRGASAAFRTRKGACAHGTVLAELCGLCKDELRRAVDYLGATDLGNGFYAWQPFADFVRARDPESDFYLVSTVKQLCAWDRDAFVEPVTGKRTYGCGLHHVSRKMPPCWTPTRQIIERVTIRATGEVRYFADYAAAYPFLSRIPSSMNWKSERIKIDLATGAEMPA